MSDLDTDPSTCDGLFFLQFSAQLRNVFTIDQTGNEKALFTNMSGFGLAIVAAYFLLLICIVYAVQRQLGTASSEKYFLAGRSLPWWAIGCSLFAANVGTDHLVGLAGSGAAGGLAVGNYEWTAVYVLMILGWCFVPRYLAMGIYTVPEYLEKRFSKQMRTFFMVLTLLTTFLTKITVTLFAGCVVIQQVVGLDRWTSSIILMCLTGTYTTIGGLGAVVYTDTLNCIVLIVGTLLLLYYGMSAVGGWDGLHEKLPDSYFKVLRPMSDENYPWLGMMVGQFINGLWYWCTDQVMVQRVLATSSVAEAQKGIVLAAWLKILPMYLMVLPGLIAAALFPQEIAADSNRAFPLLVTRVMPPLSSGVMVAVMLSSFMSSLGSCFTASSTLFTMDIYAQIYPEATETSLVQAGRMFTVVVALASIAWLPVISSLNDQLFLYIQQLQCIWVAPISAVFVGSLLSEDMSTRTAWTGICLGMPFGALFYFIQHVFPLAWLPAFIISNSLHKCNMLVFIIALFGVCVLAMVISHQIELRGKSDESIELLQKLPERDAATLKNQSAGFTTIAMASSVVVVVIALTVFHSV